MKKSKILFIIALVSFLVAGLLMIISFSLDESESVSVSDVSAVMSKEESQIESVEDVSIEISDVFAESDVVSEPKDESDTSTAEPIETLHGWIINNLGYTYIYDNSGYEQFNYKNSALERYINSINNIAAVLPESVKVFNITAPVSSTFADIPREIYVNDNFFNSSQTAFVSNVESKLDESILNIPIVSLLEEMYDNGEYVFYRTDRNWTALAAYKAYNEFCGAAGFDPYSLEEHEQISAGKYLGSFYNAISFDNESGKNDKYIEYLCKTPDEVIAYKCIKDVKTSLTIYTNENVYTNYSLCENEVSLTNAYDVFLGREAERYEIMSSANGGNLLIIGDSSVYPMVSFLASHYRKIDIINPSLYNGNVKEFLNGREYDHALIMCYSTNAVSGQYVPSLNIFAGVTEENG